MVIRLSAAERARLKADVAAAAIEAECCDAEAADYRDLADEALRELHGRLSALADRLDGYWARVEALRPVDQSLLASAAVARRRARHCEVWAAFVLHERLPAHAPRDGEDEPD